MSGSPVGDSLRLIAAGGNLADHKVYTGANVSDGGMLRQYRTNSDAVFQEWRTYCEVLGCAQSFGNIAQS